MTSAEQKCEISNVIARNPTYTVTKEKESESNAKLQDSDAIKSAVSVKNVTDI